MIRKQDPDYYFIIENMIDNNDSDEIIIKELDKIKDNNIYLKNDILSLFIVNRRFEILNYLYGKQIPFIYKDAAGATALHVACGISGSLPAVKFLFENHLLTDVNAKTDENETPFLLAVMYNHEDIIRYFLQHSKPDFSINTIYGESVFSLAKKNNNKEIIKLLEQYSPC